MKKKIIARRKGIRQFELSTILTNSKGGVNVKTIIPKEQIEAIFNTPGQGLYAWVTESQFHRMLWDGKDPIKFGQYGTESVGGTTPQETIMGYSWVPGEAKVILWALRFTEEIIQKVGTAYDVEQIVNKKIGQIVVDGDGRETFRTSVDIIQTQVAQTVFQTDGGRKATYGLRPRQKEFVDKFVAHRKSGGEQFLLGAIMRYGKNFAWLNTITELHKAGVYKKGDVFMVLTSKPGVFDTLESDISSHVFFKDFDFIKLKDKKDKTSVRPDPKRITVVAVSTQLAYNNVSGRKTVNFLKGIRFRDVFIDECHSGTSTKKFELLIKELKIDHKTYASGTPFKTQVDKGITSENSYFYGYVQQQMDKRRDIELGIANDSVTLQCRIIQIDPRYSKNPNFSTEENGTINKILSVGKDGEFIFGGDAKELILDILGKSSNRAKYSPYRLCAGKLDHTVWLLPSSVKVAEAVGRLLKEIAPEYEVIIAAGGNTKEINVVHKAIKHSGKKTITLTIGRFVEGTTVPKWTGAFVFCDTESLEKYFQFIFRVATPSDGKDTAYVFDFSLERVFQQVYEMAVEDSARSSHNDPKRCLKEWLDCYNVIRMGDGPEGVLVNIEDILNEISSNDYRSATLIKTHQQWINIDRIDVVVDSLKDLTLDVGKSVNVSNRFVSNALEGAKNYRLIGVKRNTVKSSLSDVDKSLRNLVKIVSLLPSFAYMNGQRTIEGVAKRVGNDYFVEYLGVTKSEFNRWLDEGVFQTNRINPYL